jgi:type I restriction enzyme M protein
VTGIHHLAEELKEAVKNLNGGGEVVHRTPQDIMDEIAALDAESAAVLKTIRGLL